MVMQTNQHLEAKGAEWPYNAIGVQYTFLKRLLVGIGREIVSLTIPVI